MFKNITHKINSSINSKFIFAFVFCLIIPLLFLESLFSYQFRKILMNKEVQYMSDKISISSSQLNNVLKDMNDIVNSLILNSDFMNIMVSEEKIPTYEWFQEFKWMQNILNSLATKNNVIYSITVIGSDNKQYKSSSNYNNNLSIYSALVKRILDAKGEVVLLNRYLEGIDDNDTITLGKAIKKFNQIVGVILVDAPPDAIDSALNIFNENEGAVYILNKDKYVLFTTDKNISSSILPDELAKSLNSYRTTLQTENKEYLYLVEESNETPCAIVVLIPKKNVFKESSLLTLQLSLGFSIIILVTVCIIVLLSSQISKNIKNLNKAISQFDASGHLVSIVLKSTDEVGQLTESFIAMANRINNLMEQIRENERNKWELEFKALQSQINPHMIYNTLNTITYLAQLQNVSNIEEVSSSFARLLRTISNYSGEFISIKDELECVHAYISIKKYNLLWDFDTVFEIDPNVYSYKILKLLLQPLIENSIIHGFSGINFKGQIIIKINLVEDRIQIDISDNGKGMDEKTISQIITGEKQPVNSFTSVGIYNTLQRLKLSYGEDYVFNIDSKLNRGTWIHIEYPAHIYNPKEDRQHETSFICR